MLARVAALAALIALAGCAGWAPAGRNAARSPAPPAEAAAPAAPARVAPVVPPPPVAAPRVEAPAPTPAPLPASGADNEIIVPGAVERQVPAPAGDPRSLAQRMEDVRAWDQCVTYVQAAFESDPMSPQLETPEDYCSRSLGMAERTAVPESRRQR